MSKRTLESGFTLIETLMVVGMIGVISAIAVPMFGSTLADFKLSRRRAQSVERGRRRQDARGIELQPRRAYSWT